METLIHAGWDVDEMDENGWTALMHLAARQSPSGDDDKAKLERKLELDLVGVLIQAGAGVDIRGNNLESPINLAVQNDKLKMVKMLVTMGGADVNATDDYRRTPLTWAAAYGGARNSLKIVDYLLNHQAVRPFLYTSCRTSESYFL